MIVGGAFLYGKDVVVYSRWYGKTATVLFYLAIVVSLFNKQFELNNFWTNLDMWIYCIALGMTMFALIAYVWSLYHNGFIDKKDLNKEVTVNKK